MPSFQVSTTTTTTTTSQITAAENHHRVSKSELGLTTYKPERHRKSVNYPHFEVQQGRAANSNSIYPQTASTPAWDLCLQRCQVAHRQAHLHAPARLKITRECKVRPLQR
jgi:hypothetical protein